MKRSLNIVRVLKQPLNIPIKGDKYELYQDYTYTWTKDGVMQRITVPKGFIYDGASAPRAVWTISGITPDGLLRAGATVHDWLYKYAGKVPEESHQILKSGKWVPAKHIWTRQEADRMLGRLMREAGCGSFRRKAAFLTTRLFGFLNWD